MVFSDSCISSAFREGGADKAYQAEWREMEDLSMAYAGTMRACNACEGAPVGSTGDSQHGWALKLWY